MSKITECTPGTHYLLRQRWRMEVDSHDDIMVVKCTRRASKEATEDYGFEPEDLVYFGEDVKDGEEKLFVFDDVILPIQLP